MIVIDLSTIYRSSIGSLATQQIVGELKLPIDLSPNRAKINIQANLNRVSEGIILKLNITSLIDLNCDRCQKLFTLKVKSIFDNLIDNNQLLHLRHFQFDLNPIILDSILLNLPIKRLCKQSCLGLCLKCGQDLNIKSCQCK